MRAVGVVGVCVWDWEGNRLREGWETKAETFSLTENPAVPGCGRFS